MATVGTITGNGDNYRNYVYTISGLNATGTTPSMRSFGFVIGSWQVTGITANGLTAALYGSNDNTNFYAIQTSTAAVDGLYGLIAGTQAAAASDYNYSNIVPLYYRFLMGGTEGSGSATITVALMSTFG
jgi:hypothetical protein